VAAALVFGRAVIAFAASDEPKNRAVQLWPPACAAAE